MSIGRRGPAGGCCRDHSAGRHSKDEVTVTSCEQTIWTRPRDVRIFYHASRSRRIDFSANDLRCDRLRTSLGQPLYKSGLVLVDAPTWHRDVRSFYHVDRCRRIGSSGGDLRCDRLRTSLGQPSYNSQRVPVDAPTWHRDVRSFYHVERSSPSRPARVMPSRCVQRSGSTLKRRSDGAED